MAPVCSNCSGTDFVWANELKTGMTGGGALSIRARGDLPLGTRICRSCGHADLFLRDISILHQPHLWRPGEFIPIVAKTSTKAVMHHTPDPSPPAAPVALAPTPSPVAPMAAPAPMAYSPPPAAPAPPPPPPVPEPEPPAREPEPVVVAEPMAEPEPPAPVEEPSTDEMPVEKPKPARRRSTRSKS